MSNSKRRQEKKRLERKEFLARRERSKGSVEGALRSLRHHISFPEPRSWPGAADASLNRPDHIKYELAALTDRGIGSDLRKQLETRLSRGLLEFIPEIKHWGMEEFFWHGLPGNPWHAIDHFLRRQGERFPEAARVQLMRWKEARIGCYEVGAVADDLVSLRELDVAGRPIGAWVRAIALNIGGVNFFRQHRGKINVTYLAPWSPERNISCAMGYGLFVPPSQLAMVAPLVGGLRSIEAVTFPLPWRAGKLAAQQCLQQWRERDWFEHMRSRVLCPFEACIMGNELAWHGTIVEMFTSSAEDYERAGLYFVMNDRHKSICGASAIVPLDFDSPSAMAFAEYREYRRLIGPPQGSPRSVQ